YYESVGITHEKTVPRTPQQNDVVERWNRTLVEAAQTMLIFSKAPLFLWAERSQETQSRTLKAKRSQEHLFLQNPINNIRPPRLS
ncbi:retrovirus-related pol polyprotein from transposon TNT 1-94, partial [Tanacetum coccineum]